MEETCHWLVVVFVVVLKRNNCFKYIVESLARDHLHGRPLLLLAVIWFADINILYQSPGEIKRREAGWTLTKKLDTFAGPGEIKRREVVLDPQVSPEEIKNRGVELGSESCTSVASSCYSTAVLWTLSLWLCSAEHLKHQLHSTLVPTQWQGDTTLTFWLFRRWSMASSVFQVGACSWGFTLSPPSPHVPVPNRPSYLCVRKAKCLLIN